MISCRELHFCYPGESFHLKVKELTVARGETVALVGPSGCGKTTLIQLIGGILVPEAGTVEVDGVVVNRLTLPQRQAFRLGNIGLVPQNFELLEYLSVRENMLVPIRLARSGKVSGEDRARVEALAERTGMAAFLDKKPSQLSQGERQRAALCRGLIGRPKLILADEPTGNLDPENQDRIVSLLLEEAGRLEASVLMITHEPSILPRFDRVISVMDLREEAG